MELRLKNYGTIEITNATLVDGGDIMIEAADRFEGLAKNFDCDIKFAVLVNVYMSWDLVIRFDIDEDDFEEETVMIFEIENQEEVYKLNALL